MLYAWSNVALEEGKAVRITVLMWDRCEKFLAKV